MPTLRVLITGFGPFPGVDRNYSADLAVAVCSALAAQPATHTHTRLCVHTAELTVEWQSVQAQLAHLYKKHRPKIAVHFGVCRSVTGFVIEQQAHNSCTPDLDAFGCQPTSHVLEAGACEVLKTRLSVTDIIADCKMIDVNIVSSDDAGRYLCNAAYYTSLSLAAHQTPPSDALFIHVPGTLNKNTPRWPLFVEAAQNIINCAINQQQRITR